MTPLLKKILGMNWMVTAVMYGLLIFGVFSIASAARHFDEGGEYFANRQKIWIILGSVVYFGAALLDYKWIRWLGIPGYIVGVALTLYTIVSGSEVHQISLGSISFQPAQFMIGAGILLIGSILNDLPKISPWLGLPIFRVLTIGVLSGIPFILVIMVGDMGSALVWLPVAGAAMLVGGVPFRYLIVMVFLGVGSLPILYRFVLPEVSERGTSRVELYLDLLNGREVDITDEGYASHYVSMAVGKAGWQGIGYKATSAKGSLHDKKFVPWRTAHNDFIFAVIAEEQGFRGSALLVTAFCLLMIQCLFIAYYSRDLAGRVIACCIVALLFAHVFENIGMCVNLLPITGIPLPLISYSGTFAVICMALLGIVQSIWIHRNAENSEEKNASDFSHTSRVALQASQV